MVPNPNQGLVESTSSITQPGIIRGIEVAVGGFYQVGSGFKQEFSEG